MRIRKAIISDLPSIELVINDAKVIMRNSGNYTQWNGIYPFDVISNDDIKNNNGYVVVDDSNNVIAYFALIEGIEPTYNYIEGKWFSDDNYITIHRIAKRNLYNGIFNYIISYVKEKYNHIRIDTHKDNKIMLKQIENNDFIYTGIIYVNDGTPRNAYEYMCKTF